MNIENLALGYVATAPSPATTGTTLTLETGEGARFPATTTASFYATLMPADANPHSENAEVVEVTDRTGDVLTIVRGQRGTTGKTVAVGWIVLNSVYKEDLDDLKGSNSFIFSETPTGDVDGVNDTFTLANTPTTNTLQLFRDGQLLKGGGVDYTLTGDEIVFTSAPEVDSILLAHYHKVAVGSGNADTLDGLQGSEYATITGTETLTNKTLTSPVLNTGVSGSAIDTTTTLGTSDTKVPSQKAVKAYVDRAKTYIQAKRVGTQTIANNTATKVGFNSEDSDYLNEFDPTTNYRFTASEAGVYAFYVNIQFVYATTVLIRGYINGTGDNTMYYITTQPENYRSNIATFIKSLKATDYVEIYVTQSYGSNNDIHSDQTTRLVISRVD